MHSAPRAYKPQGGRLQGWSSASSPSRLLHRASNQEPRELSSHQAPRLKGNKVDHHCEQEGEAARVTPRDFSKIPIHAPEQPASASRLSTLAQTTACNDGSYPHQSRRAAPLRPRIELDAISLHSLPSDEIRNGALRDGSPDDLEQMEGDQDALMPSVFERKPSGRGVHIRVQGGNPQGTPDFPDGIRWVQTIDTNAPLFNQNPPYVDFAPPKDDKPFYFPDARENATFSDNPSRKANGVRWDATLSLVGVHERTITRFDSVNYGFDIDASGTLNLHGPSTTGVADLVIHGDTLRSEYPDWVFSGGFAVPQVPSGGAAGGT